MQTVELAAELVPGGHIATVVKLQLYPATHVVHVEEAAYEYVPLAQAVLIPSLQAYPFSQGSQLVDFAVE